MRRPYEGCRGWCRKHKATLAYLVLAAAVVYGFYLVNQNFSALNQLRFERALDTAHSDKQLCERAKTNAQVNIKQNNRLATLLDAALKARRPDSEPNAFSIAAARAILKIGEENAELKPAAQANCENLRSNHIEEQTSGN